MSPWPNYLDLTDRIPVLLADCVASDDKAARHCAAMFSAQLESPTIDFASFRLGYIAGRTLFENADFSGDHPDA